MASLKTFLLLLVALAATSAAASAENLVEVGDDSLGLTVQHLEATSTVLRARVEIENLSRSHEVFLHYEPDRTDALDYFFIPRARQARKNTVFIRMAPEATRSADIAFALAPGQRPGLLVLGSYDPPFDQVSVAVGPLIHVRPAIAVAAAPSPTPLHVAAVPSPVPPPYHVAVVRPESAHLTPRHRPAHAVATPHPRTRATAEPSIVIAAAPPRRQPHPRPRPERIATPRPRPIAPPRPRPFPSHPQVAASSAQVVFIPPNPHDRVLSVFASPMATLGKVLILWRGHLGQQGYGWSRIHSEHPDVGVSEIAYAATYPHQIWTDGHTYLFVRWNSAHGGALVLQVAGSTIVSARWATYDDLVYWLGPGRIYPRLVYQGS